MLNLQEYNCKNVRIKSLADNILSSVAQSFKACAISAGHVAEWGGTLKIRPGFRMGEINGEEKTIMRFLVECE